MEFLSSMEIACEKRPAVRAAAKISIFENLKREALLQLHPRRAQQGANRLGRSTLAANDFSQVLAVHAQLQYRHLRSLDGLHFNVLGMVHKGPGDCFDQLLHLGNSA